jgi:hypothetical protein
MMTKEELDAFELEAMTLTGKLLDTINAEKARADVASLALAFALCGLLIQSGVSFQRLAMLCNTAWVKMGGNSPLDELRAMFAPKPPPGTLS